MKRFDILCPIEELSFDELSQEDERLVEAARIACLEAYAPYSHFHVGAAVMLEDGTIVTGSNQENAAYPSGMCAERTAAFYAHAKYPELKFKKIAISCLGAEGEMLDEPVTPCGACRQALLEFENLAGSPVEVILHGAAKTYRLPSIKSLLPLSFSKIP